MTSLLKTRRLAKNYKKIRRVKDFVERYLRGETYLCKNVDKRDIIRLNRYIDLYLTMFEKSFSSLDDEDKQAVEEIYKKGKSVICFSIENYICESEAYKRLKKFDVLFHYDILKVSRMVNPLLDVCKNNKRRNQRR